MTGDGSGEPEHVFINDAGAARIVAYPHHGTLDQFVDGSKVLIAFTDAPANREKARHVVMTRHEASQMIEQLKMAVTAMDRGERYDSGPPLPPEAAGASPGGEGGGAAAPPLSRPGGE